MDWFGLAATTSCPSVKPQRRSLSRFGTFQNVAVAPARMQIPKYASFLWECPFSKCCCGPHEARNFHLHHHMSPNAIIKIIQKQQENPSKLECLFFVVARPSSFQRKSSVIISLLGVPPFVCVCLLFRIDVFPIDKLTFWAAHGRPISYNFHFCCFLLGNTYILARPRIACFHIDFTFVARPC